MYQDSNGILVRGPRLVRKRPVAMNHEKWNVALDATIPEFTSFLDMLDQSIRHLQEIRTLEYLKTEGYLPSDAEKICSSSDSESEDDDDESEDDSSDDEDRPIKDDESEDDNSDDESDDDELPELIESDD